MQDASSNPHFIGFSANPADPFDQLTPAASPSQSRTPVILEFDRTRINQTANTNKSGLTPSTGVFYNLYQYYPPNGKDMTSGTYMPYLYYKAVPLPTNPPPKASVYTTSPTQIAVQQAWSWVESNLYMQGSVTVLNCQPYVDSTAPASTPPTFVNPQSFQLLCPGLDGIYGGTTGGSPVGSNPPQYPSGLNYNPSTGVDDMTNFTQGPTVGNDVK